MPKNGQARVLTPRQFAHLVAVIPEHRHPEKNLALVHISFKLGLRVQEIALLELGDVCRLGPASTSARDFTLLELLILRAAITKGADALKRSTSTYERRTLSFKKHDFDQIIRQVEKLANAGAPIDPADYYPELKKHRGKTRELPMNDSELRDALQSYLEVRLSADPKAKPKDPLFLSQKGGPYSPNTLQEHIALMLRNWAGVERASSHSGRRTLLTEIIHGQRGSVKIAQKIAGHVSPATTIIYEEPPEQSVKEALQKAGERYSSE